MSVVCDMSKPSSRERESDNSDDSMQRIHLLSHFWAIQYVKHFLTFGVVDFVFSLMTFYNCNCWAQ